MVLDAQLSANEHTWEMQPDGTYRRGAAAGQSAQQLIIECAERRRKQAGRLRKRRPKGLTERRIA